MNSGGAGVGRSRKRREAIPNPISRTSPVVELTRTLGGFTSRWISSSLCSPPSAVARPTAKRKNCVVSRGPGRRRSRVSPPGSSSTRVVCRCCWERARGRTAQAGSNSSFSEYSCSIFLRLSSAGRVEAGASKITDEGLSRYKRNSSSLRRSSRTSAESSTMTVLHFQGGSSLVD
jgi:hypothetical protein